MPRISAATVDDYINQLPDDRRRVMREIRALIKKNLPKGYREGINWGAIAYEIPLEKYADTYNKQPLGYVALAAQKHYYALYLLGAYGDPKQRAALEAAFAESGKKMDMGKSCLRFKSPDDLPLDALGKIIASTPPEKMIEIYEAGRGRKRSAKKKRA